MLGVLSAPFMRAALLVDVDPTQARFPSARAAVFFPNRLGRPVATRLVPQESPTWVVPTRQPDRLRAAIGRLGLPDN
jgi:hypothetical protein